MKHLFFVRHGNYEYNGFDAEEMYTLSSKGTRRLVALSKKIKELVASEAYILSSPESVALASAEILAEALEAEIEECPILFPEDCRVNNRYAGWVYDEIDKQREQPALILVSHSELADSFINALAQRELGVKTELSPLDMGRAIHYDLESRTCQLLAP